MKAGQEMDALVEELIFGLERYPGNPEYLTCRNDGASCTNPTMPRSFSTDIASAMQIVDKWIDDDDHDIFMEYWRDGEWFVAFKNILDKPRDPKGHCDGRVTGVPSLPLAICRAALASVGYKGEESE